MDTVFQIESFDTFQTVLEEIISNMFYVKQIPCMPIEVQVIEKAKQEVKTIIYDCNFDVDNILHIIQNKSWDVDKVNYFVKLLKTQKSEILSAALNHCNSAFGDTLEDFNWVLKYVLGTSELKTFNYPLMQLTLTLLSSNGDHKKIMYEMNKESLAKLIDCLENINSND